MAHVSLGAAEGKVGPPPKNPPVWSGRLGIALKVLGVIRVVWELAEKVRELFRRREPTGVRAAARLGARYLRI